MRLESSRPTRCLEYLDPLPHHAPPVKTITHLFLSAVMLAVGASARADTLTLKNGTVLNGKYLNSTGEAVRFQTVTGDVQTIAQAEILSLSTDPGSAAMTPAATAAYSPAVVNVSLPAGTVLLVQLMDRISSKSEPGASFTAKLATDLVADGMVAARAGTIVYGRVQGSTPADRKAGKSAPDLRLTQMVANGIPVALATGSFTPHADPEGKKAVAGEGTAPLNSGQTPAIPTGALLEFTLQQPVTVTMVR